MSVRNKVKRLNKEIKDLNKVITELNREKDLANEKSKYELLLENIIKFLITRAIGGLRGGAAVDLFEIDKMKDLKLVIEKNPIEHAYLIRIFFNNREA